MQVNNEKYNERLSILNKRDEYEKQGWFDRDLEDDPPAPVLDWNPDYLNKKLSSKIKTAITTCVAGKFLRTIKKNKILMIEEIKGLENFEKVKGGAIITCNHFSPMDSFVMEEVYRSSKYFKKKKLFRVIREGNYTNFPGLFGKMMRNCNTLPLSSNMKIMELFMRSVDIILTRGDYVLIYPEQGMWWNYKKPRPLKEGGFKFAIKSNVPVIPCFITMEDSDIIADDGFPIQKFSVKVGEPIYKNEKLNKKEQVKEMMDKNFEFWKSIYEKTYNKKLEYLKKED